MQESEAISIVAAELGVFRWESDENGRYGATLMDGSQIRLHTQGGTQLLLEGELLAEVTPIFSKVDTCLALLKMNFARSIVDGGILMYVPEYDEIALTQIIATENCNEDSLANEVEKFLLAVDQNRKTIQSIIRTSGSMPFTPYGSK
ncbi:MAG: hypothetical protein LBI69_04525 [Puniceicoccales bacterium]|jgi:hypothetical protein|nr:hypothetical protein [Puniceicoccales bacterium]